MKDCEKERYRYYIKRFLNPDVPVRLKWVAFWRYIGMAVGLIAEKIKGGWIMQ